MFKEGFEEDTLTSNVLIADDHVVKFLMLTVVNALLEYMRIVLEYINQPSYDDVNTIYFNQQETHP